MSNNEPHPPLIPAQDTESPPVFISYCQQDKSIADQICGALEAAGIACWIAPRNVRPGENWGRSIIQSIAAAKVMVVIFSGHTNDSPHVLNEVERAVSRRMVILPFRIEKVQPSEDFELFISSRHWLDAFGPKLEPKIAELTQAVQTALGQASSPTQLSASTISLPSSAAPSSRRGLIFVSIVVLLLVGGGVFFFMERFASKKEGISTASQAIPTATPERTNTPSSTVQPTPTPPEDLLSRAKEFETSQDFVAALGIYTEILLRQPQDQTARDRAENVMARLEEKPAAALGNIKLLNTLRQLADIKFGRACMFLGSLVREADPVESLALLKIAADQGNRRAMVMVGDMIASGEGGHRTDFVEAATWFKKAAEQGDSEGMLLYGECLLDGQGTTQNDAEAARYFSSAMSLGEIRAKSKLAQLYRSGRGVPQVDLPLAYRLFQEAADQGFLEAQGNLGVMIMNGESVPADPKKAVSLWKDGAEKGDTICMLFYAMSLEGGALGTPDKTAAAEWYRKAATLKNPKAIEWCVSNNIAF